MAKQATSASQLSSRHLGIQFGNGLVASLARPGGNVTGLSIQSADLAGKRIELLREFSPVSAGGIMGNARHRSAGDGEVQTTARKLGLEVVAPKSGARKISARLRGAKGHADALYVVPDPLVNTNRMRINTLALGARLPTMYSTREYVEAGGIMSYGPNYPDLFRRAAD